MTLPAAAAQAIPKGAQKLGFDQLYAPIAPAMETLSRLLESQKDDFEPEIRELVTYTLANSGKRLRPILLFYTGMSHEGQISGELVKAAAVVEMVHVATLVHDDVLDSAELRHRKATVAQKNGNAVAVLLGDTLFAHALKLASEFSSVAVCRLVASATQQVCSGEISQTLQRGNPEISRAGYYRIIELKTAELFRAACALGAELGGYGDLDVRAASDFGKHLGVAYQIFDDFADLFGQESKIGKTLGTDLSSGKVTLPMILLKEQLSDERFVSLFDNARRGVDSAQSEFLDALRCDAVMTGVIEEFEAHILSAKIALNRYDGRYASDYLNLICDLVTTQVQSMVE
ncbi:MAG: polyprenyl synthetase family protein [Opitutales bacterium]|nr:polyprenyl synthetase family protein [Opitutales bacterium]